MSERPIYKQLDFYGMSLLHRNLKFDIKTALGSCREVIDPARKSRRSRVSTWQFFTGKGVSLNWAVLFQKFGVPDLSPGTKYCLLVGLDEKADAGTPVSAFVCIPLQDASILHFC